MIGNTYNDLPFYLPSRELITKPPTTTTVYGLEQKKTSMMKSLLFSLLLL